MISMLALLCAGPARAADPAAQVPAPAWRLHAAPSQDRASLRLAAVPGPASVFSEALRLRMGSEQWSAEVEQVLVQAFAPELDWRHAAVGRTRLTGRVHFAEGHRHAWLLEGDLGLDDAVAWGSHSMETTRGFGLRTGWEGSWVPGRSTLLARVDLGIGRQAPLAGIFPFSTGSGFAWICPLGAELGLASVLELEVQLVDAVPMAGRWLLRWSSQDDVWMVDLGGQLSTDYDSETGDGAVIAQLGRRL